MNYVSSPTSGGQMDLTCSWLYEYVANNKIIETLYAVKKSD